MCGDTEWVGILGYSRSYCMCRASLLGSSLLGSSLLAGWLSKLML